MANFCLTIQYDGTRYNGWQKQGNTDNTIQGKLEAILEHLYGEPIDLNGSGRTDAGVHAMCQIANFRIPRLMSRYSCQQLQDYFNQKSWYYGYIPADTFDNSTLNTFEVANAELLQRYEYMYAPGGYQLQ